MQTGYIDPESFKLDAIQKESILDRLVPVLAAPADYEYFRGVIGLKLDELNSAECAVFVSKLLEAAAK